MEKLGAAMPTQIFMDHNKVVYMLSNEGLKFKTFETPTFIIAPPLFVNGEVRTAISETIYFRKFNLCNNYVHDLPMSLNSNSLVLSSISLK